MALWSAEFRSSRSVLSSMNASIPGCLQTAMEKKNAPAVLREQPDRIEALMREEAPGILFKWLQCCREFIDAGEHMRDWPDVIRLATAAMFKESDLHGRFCEERLVFGGRSRT